MPSHAIEMQETLREIVEEAERGEEVVLTKRGEPVARIVPIETVRPRVFGSAKGRIKIAEDFDEPLDDFRDLIE